MTLEQIGVLTGILSAICTGIYFLLKNLKQIKRKIRTKVFGKWGNEGDIVWIKNETHIVELELEVDIEDGEITGTIKSQSINDESFSPLCSVNGQLKFNSATIQISHLRHGEFLVYGKAKIELKKKTLHWKLIDGIANFFPDCTKLQKQIIPKNL